MKNNKGFTLVEMLAVLAIIAILSVAIFPNFLSMKESQSEKFSESMNILLKSAAKIYVSNNRSIVDEELKKGPYCITIAALKAYDYVSIPTYDPVSNDKINTNRCVYISKTDGSKTKYSYKVSKDALDPEEDHLPPEIFLKEKDEVAEGTCKNTMVVTSKEDFESKCSVTGKDNVDTVITPYILSEERIGDNYIIKYMAKDSSGNYAKTFVVKLILSSDKSQ